jgi:hypothetical protein
VFVHTLVTMLALALIDAVTSSTVEVDEPLYTVVANSVGERLGVSIPPRSTLDTLLLSGALCVLAALCIWLRHLVCTSGWYVHYWLRAPPLVSGLLPFVGCAVRFAAGPPVQFIPECQRRLGDVFTLHLAGRHLTFLLNPRHFPLFFQSPEHQVGDDGRWKVEGGVCSHE